MRSLLIILILAVIPNLFGQEWDSYLENEMVKIDFSRVNVFKDDDSGAKIIFRFTNKIDDSINLKFTRKVRYTNGLFFKKRRTKFIIALAGNEIKEADLKSKEYMNTIFQLFLGWSADRWRIDSFMIEKLNQF